MYNTQWKIVRSFLKCSKEELKQMGQRTRKLMKMHKVLRRCQTVYDNKRRRKRTYCCGSLTHFTIMDSSHYNQSFIKNFHDLHAPLNELLKEDKKGKWTPECQTAFDQIKKALTSDLSLTHYDPKLEIIVASDASSYGVGSCILHKMPDETKKPIAHASRTLLPAEKPYSQIEKEALGIIFAVTKFHRYLHSRFFTLQTDHKPPITKKGSTNLYCQ